MKRFTETEKWRDPWFRKLTPEHKLLWTFICDTCDNAGVWDPDEALANFSIGRDVPLPGALEAFNGRVTILRNGKWHIVKFVHFQAGKLNPACRPHQAILALQERHGIGKASEGQNKGYTKGIDTLQEKEKEKEKEKDREGGHGETHVRSGTCDNTSLPSRTMALKQLVADAYSRAPGERWSGLEEGVLCEVARRDGCLAEFDTLMLYRLREEQWFPRSVRALLEKWGETLDKARAPEVNGQSRGAFPPTLHQQLKATEALIDKHVANPRRDDRTRVPTEEEREHFRGLKRKLTELQRQIAGDL